jgi:hypothetical protein
MRIYTDKQLAEIEKNGVICPECGKKSMDQQNGYKVRKNYCFSCNFWTDRLEELDKDDDVYRLVIDKHHYQTHKNPEQRKRNKYSGFGGRKFLIKINETQEIIETCNLWHQGQIPIHFLDRLPDNASFVNDHHWVNVNGTECISSD